MVRNVNVANTQFPLGLDVPGTVVPFSPALGDDMLYVFTPSAAYGPGILPGQGYDIEVRVGTFASPVVAPILGLPMGMAAV